MEEKANPIARLFGSSKAIIVMAVLAVTGVALCLGKVTWQQFEYIIGLVVGPWLVAVGAEDVAKHLSKGKVDAEKAKGVAAVDVVKANSINPPPMSPAPGGVSVIIEEKQ